MSYTEQGAFPYPIRADEPYHFGLTKREWFAGMAMIGYLAAHADPACEFPSDEKLVKWSFESADAMLAEAQKTGGGS